MSIAELIVATIANVILPRRIAELEGITEEIDGHTFRPNLWAARTASARVSEDGTVEVNSAATANPRAARQEATAAIESALIEIDRVADDEIVDYGDGEDRRGSFLVLA